MSSAAVDDDGQLVLPEDEQLGQLDRERQEPAHVLADLDAVEVHGRVGHHPIEVRNTRPSAGGAMGKRLR